MIEVIVRLINRLRGEKPTMVEKTDSNEPLYGDITKPRCPRCNGPMIEVNINTRIHKMECGNPMCRR
jgi:hypothetical protein